MPISDSQRTNRAVTGRDRWQAARLARRSTVVGSLFSMFGRGDPVENHHFSLGEPADVDGITGVKFPLLTIRTRLPAPIPYLSSKGGHGERGAEVLSTG